MRLPIPERINGWVLTIGTICGAGLMLVVSIWGQVSGEVCGFDAPPFTRVAAYASGGLIAGFAGAILGVGGAFIVVPFLVLVMGLSMHHAAAASIVGVLAVSSAAAPGNLKHGFSNVRLAMCMLLTSIIGVIIGGQLANVIEERYLGRILGLVLLFGAYSLWRRIRMRAEPMPHEDDLGNLGGRYFDPARKELVTYHVKRLPATIGSSLSGGLTSSLLGIGGGTVNVPVMRLLTGVPMRAAASTSIYIMGVTAASAAFVHFQDGNSAPLVIAPLALGTLFGSLLGSRASRYIHGHFIQYIFVGLLVLIAGRMLLGDYSSDDPAKVGATLECISMQWYEVFAVILKGDASALPALGLLILMFTPILGLISAMIVAGLRRDWRLALMALSVLLLVAVNLVIATLL